MDEGEYDLGLHVIDAVEEEIRGSTIDVGKDDLRCSAMGSCEGELKIPIIKLGEEEH